MHILAIDCCEDTIKLFEHLPAAKLTQFNSRADVNGSLRKYEVDWIVIGVSRLPVRRFYLNKIRRVFPHVPMLIMRREKNEPMSDEEHLRGEFLLSDEPQPNDLEMVAEMRRHFPIKPCTHLHHGFSYELVRETLEVITANYSDPNLNLNDVAKRLPTSPSKLSRLLNKQVGISFRQLLKHVRIEEAKLMLATHKYSVKEVAARAGFSDSHYFSRSFKEVTGLNATEYEYSFRDLILH